MKHSLYLLIIICCLTRAMEQKPQPQFVYHFAENVVDGKIYPLAQLQKKQKLLYDIRKQKSDHKGSCNNYLEPLQCNWQDAVHCMQINPKLIQEYLWNIGYSLSQEKLCYYQIPLERVRTKEAVLYVPTQQLLNRSFLTRKYSDEIFKKFDPQSYKELKIMTLEKSDQFDKKREKGESSLAELLLPTLIVKGKISVKDLPLYDWRTGEQVGQK